MAIDIVDFPIKNGGSFHSFLYVYQAGYLGRDTTCPSHIPLTHVLLWKAPSGRRPWPGQWRAEKPRDGLAKFGVTKHYVRDMGISHDYPMNVHYHMTIWDWHCAAYIIPWLSDECPWPYDHMGLMPMLGNNATWLSDYYKSHIIPFCPTITQQRHVE